MFDEGESREGLVCVAPISTVQIKYRSYIMLQNDPLSGRKDNVLLAES